MLKVYLASRFSRLPELVGYKAELEATGLVTVRARWLLGGHEFVGVPDDQISRVDQARFANEDLADIDHADMVVCFTEPPDTTARRGGRHVEMGYALARAKPIVVVGPGENVFYALGRVLRYDDWDQGRAQVLHRAKAHAVRCLHHERQTNRQAMWGD